MVQSHVDRPLNGLIPNGFSGRLAVGAAALALLAVLFAGLEPDPMAPTIVTLAGVAGILLVVAMVTSVAMALVEWRSGKAPYGGAWWFVMRWNLLFKFAWMTALALLTSIAALAWVLGAQLSDWLWQADLLLLLAGAAVGFAASAIAHILFLVLPRSH